MELPATASSTQGLPSDLFAEKVSVTNAFQKHLLDDLKTVIGSVKSRSDGAACFGGNDAERATEDDVSVEQREALLEQPCLFQVASCALQASMRTYECRVEHTYSRAFDVLGALSATNMYEDDSQSADRTQGSVAKRRRIHGVNTLERNEANIVRERVEMDECEDPVFRRMAAAFDASGRGARSLLLSQLPVGADASVALHSEKPMVRLAAEGQALFSSPPDLCIKELELGDLAAFCNDLSSFQLCPDIDRFRQELYGNVPMDVEVPISCEVPSSNATVTEPAPSRQATLGMWIRPTSRLCQKTTLGVKKSKLTGEVAQSSPCTGSPAGKANVAEALSFDELLKRFTENRHGDDGFAKTANEPVSTTEASSSLPTVAPGIISTPNKAKVPSRKQVPDLRSSPNMTKSLAPARSKQTSILPYCKKGEVKAAKGGEISYGWISKFPDVKLVKRHLRDCISEGRDDEVENAACSFQGLMERTFQKMPKVEAEKVSVAVFFSSLLHVCNDTGLELQQGDGPSLDVVGSL